jgi:hypothetical protein
MYFHHKGNIVTIYQLSFIGPHMKTNHPTSLNIPHMQVVSTLPQVNYVATCTMRSNLNEKDPLSVCSPSLDLDPIVNMVNQSLGTLDSTLPSIDLSNSLTMYSFQSIGVPYDEYLLEAMVESHEHSFILGSNLIKK